MTKDNGKKIPYVRSVLYKLDQTARILELMSRNYYKNHVLSEKGILELDEFKILSHIILDKNLSQSDISKLVYKGRAHIGKILNDMEQKNYIRRVVSTKNNMMIKNTVLTDFGKEIYEETDDRFFKIGKYILEGLDDEDVKTLAKLLDKIKNNILEKNKIYF